MTQTRRTWLMKSEPFKYAYTDLERDGRTRWDGVRNHLAKNHLQTMQVGDRFFFYHSNEGKCIVGIGEIIETAEPDTTAEADELKKDGSNPWVVVTVKPVQAVPHPVSLADMREHPALQEMALFKSARLSVQPVTAEEWRVICALAGVPQA